jgi:hypothetical protein
LTVAVAKVLSVQTASGALGVNVKPADIESPSELAALIVKEKVEVDVGVPVTTPPACRDSPVPDNPTAVYVEALLAATELEYKVPTLRSVLSTLSVQTGIGCFLFMVKVFEVVVPPVPVAFTLKVNACETPALTGDPTDDERTPAVDRVIPGGKLPLAGVRAYPVALAPVADNVLLYVVDPTLAVSFTAVVVQDGGATAAALAVFDL